MGTLEKDPFLGGSAGKEIACNAGDLALIPGLGISPGEGNSYTLQYSGLENSMDWIVHAVAESDTTEQFWLSFLDSEDSAPRIATQEVQWLSWAT